MIDETPDPAAAGDPPPPPPPPPPAPLAALRARLDAIDHELVDLLARRNEVVRDVAAVKQQTAFPIRDPAREAALLADRAARGAAQGLRAEVVESLFRVVLWASRDRQAALGASRRPDTPRRRVAVIGAGGGIGGLFASMLEELDQEVLRVDRDTTLDGPRAAADADVVLVAVPIGVTEAVIREVGPHLRDDGLMLDVTSVKTGPVAAMLEATGADVIGLHPLFGPSVHSLQGQRVVRCPARIRPEHGWDRWLAALLEARGLLVLDAEPAHHDRVMSVVQVLTHHATEVLGLTLARLGVPVDETLRFTSPVYLMELMMSARHFAQSDELYRAIQSSNPRTPEVMAAFRAATTELAAAVAADDAEAFARLFAEPRAAFGAFSTRALEDSSFLIDRLVERSG